MPYPCSMPLMNKDRVGPIRRHLFSVMIEDVLPTLLISIDEFLISAERLSENEPQCQYILAVSLSGGRGPDQGLK